MGKRKKNSNKHMGKVKNNPQLNTPVADSQVSVAVDEPITLRKIAEQLKAADKKVQLIYAFNGSGKTRLSREFKALIAPKNTDDANGDEVGLSRSKILYYNALTEDLFYWDNDLEHDREPKLKIQPNTFTDWILRERGDTDIVKNFQRYTNDKLMPLFHEVDVIRAGKKTGDKTYPEVTFSFETGSESSGKLKISKGEERNFVWSVFYTLLQEVTSILSEPDPTKRDDNQFDKLEYVFIDDPVSSLDDTHLIELAVDLADLIKRSHYHEGKGLRFVITTHSPLFYNVLHNELNNDLKNPVQDGTPAWLYKRGQSENTDWKNRLTAPLSYQPRMITLSLTIYFYCRKCVRL
ncbi:anticodon nuclease [Halopseudomonas pachastrellae]|nr:anticodon nuclease [Halopseudomonas pachastrellae]